MAMSQKGKSNKAMCKKQASCESLDLLSNSPSFDEVDDLASGSVHDDKVKCFTKTKHNQPSDEAMSSYGIGRVFNETTTIMKPAILRGRPRGQDSNRDQNVMRRASMSSRNGVSLFCSIINE